MTAAAKKLATPEDLLTIPESERFHELIDGEISERAALSSDHGTAQLAVASLLGGPFRRPTGGVVAHDRGRRPAPHGRSRPSRHFRLAARSPSGRPRDAPVTALPDWVCEIVSPPRARDDTVKKVRTYHRAGIAHYWIVDGREDTLTVYRWTADGFLVALKSERDERVRAEPSGAIEIVVGEMFGDDPV